jgi:hypothetical protein
LARVSAHATDMLYVACRSSSICHGRAGGCWRTLQHALTWMNCGRCSASCSATLLCLSGALWTQPCSVCCTLQAVQNLYEAFVHTADSTLLSLRHVVAAASAAATPEAHCSSQAPPEVEELLASVSGLDAAALDADIASLRSQLAQVSSGAVSS